MNRMMKMIAAGMLALSICACSAPKEEPAAETASSDTQNPVMNFVGRYGWNRATAEISAEGERTAVIHIHWGSSASEASEWDMTGEFDSETASVYYTDCIKKDMVFNEDGSVKSEEQVYENGKGTIFFHEDGTMTWEDLAENIAEGAVFTFAS